MPREGDRDELLIGQEQGTGVPVPVQVWESHDALQALGSLM